MEEEDAWTTVTGNTMSVIKKSAIQYIVHFSTLNSLNQKSSLISPILLYLQ